MRTSFGSNRRFRPSNRVTGVPAAVDYSDSSMERRWMEFLEANDTRVSTDADSITRMGHFIQHHDLRR